MTSGARRKSGDGATVAAGVAGALMDLAVSKGADRRRLLRRSNIDTRLLQDPDNRIPLSDYLALLRAGADLCGEPALSLQFGEAYSMPDLSIVGLVGQCADSVADAQDKVNRYAPLLVDAGEDAETDRFAFVRNADGLWFELKGRIYAEHPQLAESAFARSVCHLAREFGGRALVKAVHFTHEEPGYRAEYDRIFQVPVVFAGARNALLVDEALLSLSLPPPNRYASGIFSAHADKLLEGLERSKTTRGQLESLLIPLLHRGEVDMARIAGKMGLSRRTLYRRLKAEGVSYEDVLHDVRRRMAMHYLKVRKLPVSETAYLVGFSDPSAFSRAFKRWTGKRPGSARRREPGR